MRGPGGRAGGGARAAGELLARAPEPPVRPRALGPVAAQTLVRQRLPAASAGFAHACHAVTGGNPFLLGALLTQVIADGVAPDDDTAARLWTFGSEQVARVIERQLARLPEGTGPLARAVAVLGPGTPLRHAAALAGLQLAEAVGCADALRAAGLLEDTPELVLAHPLIAGTLYGGVPTGARALHHADAAALLVRERADPERVALHLVRTEPAGEPATVAMLRGAASRAAARGAPQTAATYLRRALAEPPVNAGEAAGLRLELALVLAAYLQTDAFELLHEAVASADTPIQRGTIALSGARACGLAGTLRYRDRALPSRSGGGRRDSRRAARADRGGADRRRVASGADRSRGARAPAPARRCCAAVGAVAHQRGVGGRLRRSPRERSADAPDLCAGRRGARARRRLGARHLGQARADRLRRA